MTTYLSKVLVVALMVLLLTNSFAYERNAAGDFNNDVGQRSLAGGRQSYDSPNDGDQNDDDDDNDNDDDDDEDDDDDYDDDDEFDEDDDDEEDEEEEEEEEEELEEKNKADNLGEERNATGENQAEQEEITAEADAEKSAGDEEATAEVGVSGEGNTERFNEFKAALQRFLTNLTLNMTAFEDLKSITDYLRTRDSKTLRDAVDEFLKGVKTTLPVGESNEEEQSSDGFSAILTRIKEALQIF